MARATREAVETARDTDAIVSFNNDKVYVTWRDSVPLEGDKLVKDEGFLIRPSSAREEEFSVYKTL